MVKRCQWVNNTFQAYIDYHDHEWGVPIHDDKKHFEFLVLESAQAGLSWSTILKKREGYRNVYQNFNPEIVSNYGESDIQNLLNDPSIVRNRKKIEASINNAQCFIEVQNHFGSYDNFIWSFVDHKPIRNSWKDIGQV
ncbi:MAG TPA: DNA-3-methyladenine glycosylase I, partial [Cyclobacteriaceae bacterium]